MHYTKIHVFILISRCPDSSWTWCRHFWFCRFFPSTRRCTKWWYQRNTWCLTQFRRKISPTSPLARLWLVVMIVPGAPAFVSRWKETTFSPISTSSEIMWKQNQETSFCATLPSGGDYCFLQKEVRSQEQNKSFHQEWLATWLMEFTTET